MWLSFWGRGHSTRSPEARSSRAQKTRCHQPVACPSVCQPGCSCWTPAGGEDPRCGCLWEKVPVLGGYTVLGCQGCTLRMGSLCGKSRCSSRHPGQLPQVGPGAVQASGQDVRPDQTGTTLHPNPHTPQGPQAQALTWTEALFQSKRPPAFWWACNLTSLDPLALFLGTYSLHIPSGCCLHSCS